MASLIEHRVTMGRCHGKRRLYCLYCSRGLCGGVVTLLLAGGREIFLRFYSVGKHRRPTTFISILASSLWVYSMQLWTAGEPASALYPWSVEEAVDILSAAQHGWGIRRGFFPFC